MLFQCWASVKDGGPTLKQHWVNTSCLMGRAYNAIGIIHIFRSCVSRGVVFKHTFVPVFYVVSYSTIFFVPVFHGMSYLFIFFIAVFHGVSYLTIFFVPLFHGVSYSTIFFVPVFHGVSYLTIFFVPVFQGVKIMRRFKQVLNPAQVFDLVNGGPKMG